MLEHVFHTKQTTSEVDIIDYKNMFEITKLKPKLTKIHLKGHLIFKQKLINLTPVVTL